MSAPLKLLQFGADGQLGLELANAAARDLRIKNTVLSQQEAEFTRPDEIRRAILSRPELDIVVNCAAYTAVDRAESEKDLARTINSIAVGTMAEACQERGVPLLHVSTDYVYDGTKPTLYVENDPTNPQNVYGATKLEGEDRIRAALPRHVILRTSWVVSSHGGNFVKTMLRLGREREELRVVDDQVGAPTSAADLAAALLTIAHTVGAPGDNERFGVFHFANDGETSWRGFAEEIFRQAPWAGVRAKVIPIPASAYPTPARRPANSRLDKSKIGQVFGIAPQSWQKALTPILADLQRQGA